MSSPGKSKKYFDSDTWLTLAITAVFIVAFITTFRMEGISTYLLPRLLSGAGILIALSILIVKYHRFSRGDLKESPARQEARSGIPVIYTAAFTTGYFLVVRYLGFILTTTLAVWLFAVLMRYRNKTVAALVGILLPIVLHLFFVTLLKLNLPEGFVESMLRF